MAAASQLPQSSKDQKYDAQLVKAGTLERNGLRVFFPAL